MSVVLTLRLGIRSHYRARRPYLQHDHAGRTTVMPRNTPALFRTPSPGCFKHFKITGATSR